MRVAAAPAGPRLSLCPRGCHRGGRAGLLRHYLLSRGPGRAGAQVAGPAACRSAGARRRAAHAAVHGPGTAGCSPAEPIGGDRLARIRHSHDRAGHRPLPGGAQADCHGGAPHGPAAPVPGDAHSPRRGTGRCARARNHDPAPEDLRPALEHARRGGQRTRHRDDALARAGIRRDSRARTHCRRGLFEGPVAPDVFSPHRAAAPRQFGRRKSAGRGAASFPLARKKSKIGAPPAIRLPRLSNCACAR